MPVRRKHQSMLAIILQTDLTAASLSCSEVGSFSSVSSLFAPITLAKGLEFACSQNRSVHACYCFSNCLYSAVLSNSKFVIGELLIFFHGFS